MSGPDSRLRTAGLYALCCAVWGSTWLVIKLGLADLPPFWFAGLRMSLACLALTPIALRSGLRKPTRSEWRSIAFCGLLQIGISYALVFKAEETIDSGLTAVIFGTFPIWVALLSHAMLPAEPLTPMRTAAAALGFSGVAIIEWPAITTLLSHRPSAAELFPLGSALAATVANIWLKKKLGGVSPSVNLWGETAVGSAFLIGLALVVRERFPTVWSGRAIASLVYLSVFGTVLTFLALFWLIPRVPMSAIGAIPVIDTLIAVVLGAVVLSEPLSTRIVAGGSLILIAAALANRPGIPAPA